MNKAYKIIWSHVRNCYVVVSEIARNHGKNNTKCIVSQLGARMQAATLQMAAAARQAFTGGERPLVRPRTAAQRRHQRRPVYGDDAWQRLLVQAVGPAR